MKKKLTIIFKGTDIKIIIDLTDLKKSSPTFKDIAVYLRQQNEQIRKTFNKKIIFEYLNLSKKYTHLTDNKYFRDHAFRVNYTFYISQEGGIILPKKEEEKTPTTQEIFTETFEPVSPPIENKTIPPPPLPKTPPPLKEEKKITPPVKKQENKYVPPVKKDEKKHIPPPPKTVGEYQKSKIVYKPLIYADIGTRIGSFIIDALVIGVGLSILQRIFSAIFVGFLYEILSTFDVSYQSFMNVLGIIVVWLYFAKMESGKKQATLGKMAVGIKVVDLKGNRISFKRATGRYFGKFLSAAFVIGFFMPAFTKYKQALHDMMAGCLIVKK